MDYIELTSKELGVISGGNEIDYNIGYFIGDHVRHGFKTIGEIIDWAFNLIPD